MLSGIRRSRALVVVLDITGVAGIDNGAATDLGQIVNAAQLMGAQLIITGISEQTTQALQWLQRGFQRFWTATDLQAGIEQADLLLTSDGTSPGGPTSATARGEA
jgi:rsbT co-antagonist protein RsbR